MGPQLEIGDRRPRRQNILLMSRDLSLPFPTSLLRAGAGQLDVGQECCERDPRWWQQVLEEARAWEASQSSGHEGRVWTGR